MTPEERERLQRIADENSVKRAADGRKQFAERWANMTPEQRQQYQRARETAGLAWRLLGGTASISEEADMLMGSPAVDLRTLPREHWDPVCNVTLPQDVQDQVHGRAEISQPELNFIEDRLRAYHGVSWPDWIECRFTPPAQFDAVLLKDLLKDTDPKDYLTQQ